MTGVIILTGLLNSFYFFISDSGLEQTQKILNNKLICESADYHIVIIDVNIEIKTSKILSV